MSLVVIIIISRVFTGRITKPVEQITDAANKLKNGEIDAEINVKSNDEIGVMADALREMIEYFQQRAEAMNLIARGDLSQTIMAKSEKDVLSLSINKMISTLVEMVEESRKLTAAAAAGELMQRGDAERFQGAYKDIVAGINQTLETITGPLQQAMRVLDRMSVNDYTTNMDGEYQGMVFEFADSKLISLRSTLRSKQPEQVNTVRASLLSRKRSETWLPEARKRQKKLPNILRQLSTRSQAVPVSQTKQLRQQAQYLTDNVRQFKL